MKLLTNVVDIDGNAIEIKWEDKKITEVGPSLSRDGHEHIIDGGGNLVTPGLIDLHVHFREPGQTHKETVATGSAAAAAGGFTTVCTMPNTNPIPHKLEDIQRILEIYQNDSVIKTEMVAALTEGLRGNKFTDFAASKDAVCAYSNDGVGVQDDEVMDKLMQASAQENFVITAHCEIEAYVNTGGSAHDGKKSKELGLIGISSESEWKEVERDAMMAHKYGGHFHVCHVSTKESVAQIKKYKELGADVSGEVSPHHLTLCEEDIPGNDAVWKMNPPLRTREDKNALIEGLKNKTLEVIATDHAPHADYEKNKGFAKSMFGIIGLEQAFPVVYTYLVETNQVPLRTIVEAMTVNPAKRFRFSDRGELKPGMAADITLIDIKTPREFTKDMIKSMSHNTMYLGKTLNGWPVMTICDGSVVFKR